MAHKRLLFHYRPHKRPTVRRFRCFGHRRNTLLYRAACVLLCLLILLTCTDFRVKKIIRKGADGVLQNRMTLLINETVGEVLEAGGVKYADLITLERGADGSVTAITTNAVRMNMLKSDLSKRLAEKMAQTDKSTIGIPWGTLTGSALLNGRGHTMKLRISLYGYALTDLVSEFASAGVNQTRHRIYLTVRVTANGFIALWHISSPVETKVLVAETIIVGSVPQVYLNP